MLVYEEANTHTSSDSMGPKTGYNDKNTTPKPAYTVKQQFRSTRTLTTSFMNDRRANGLCYFCDESYTREHSLKQKKKNYRCMFWKLEK